MGTIKDLGPYIHRLFSSITPSSGNLINREVEVEVGVGENVLNCFEKQPVQILGLDISTGISLDRQHSRYDIGCTLNGNIQLTEVSHMLLVYVLVHLCLCLIFLNAIFLLTFSMILSNYRDLNRTLLENLQHR